MRSALSLFLALPLCLPLCALDVRVLDMNEEVTTGTAIAVDGNDLVVTLADGGSKRIPCDTVVEITFPVNDGAPSANPQLEVVLTNGDVIRGDPIGGNAQSITLAAGEMGRMDVPLDNVSRVLVLIDNNREKVPADACGADQDRIYLANQDTNVGFPATDGDAITAEGLRFDGRKDVQVTYAWKEIAGWYMGSSLPVPTPNALIATAVCSGGTRLTGKVTSVTGQTLTLHHVVVGEIPVSIAAVRAIYFINGRVTYLSDLQPTRVRERPFAYDPERPETSSFPFRRDASVVAGAPLTIKNREFRKGLGVHSYSALEYATGGRYAKFCASIGVDKEGVGADGAGGSVVFRVYAGTLDQVEPELRLYVTHVTDWKALCARLEGSKRFRALIAEIDAKVENDADKALPAIHEVASGEEATDGRQVRIRNAVNEVLAMPSLYQDEDFPADTLPADARAILEKDAAKRTPLEVDRLHRRCLESVAGSSVTQVPQPAELLYDSGLARFGDDAKDTTIPIEGVASIVLVVRCGLEGDIFDSETWDRADWGGARFIR